MKLTRFELESFEDEEENETSDRPKKNLKKVRLGTNNPSKRTKDGTKRRNRQIHRAFRRGDLERF